ncbi:hypothetical protein CY35_05G057000 [Sphagnum magellanicum]|nr:hypothetical protein CY35_05G057000 [Sphagnum magellanicum]KAH9562139.1 hypothetical protein CY35_05G057000 [Sphagnum magellanicum]KAH9562140.1 hypothetical protein CY35_05G057000 [Sphagnum magellanicum]
MFVCSEESENSAPLEVPEMFPSLSLWQKKLCFVESGKQRSLGVCGELSKHDCPSLALVFFAMAMATTARSAARLLRMKASSVQRSSRTFASDAHEHGPKRVPLWEDPMNPGRWKEEHFVFVSLAGWGVLIYGGYKLFAGGSKEKKDTAPAKSSASTPAHH